MSEQNEKKSRHLRVGLSAAAVVGLTLGGAGVAAAVTSPTTPTVASPTQSAAPTADPQSSTSTSQGEVKRVRIESWGGADPSYGSGSAAPSTQAPAPEQSSQSATMTAQPARTAGFDVQPETSIVDSSGTRVQELKTGDPALVQQLISRVEPGTVSLEATDREAAEDAAKAFLVAADSMDYEVAIDAWIEPTLVNGLMTQELASQRQALLSESGVLAYWESHMVDPGKKIIPISITSTVESGSDDTALVRVVYKNDVSVGGQQWRSVDISQVYGMTRATDGSWAVSSLEQVPMVFEGTVEQTQPSTTTAPAPVPETAPVQEPVAPAPEESGVGPAQPSSAPAGSVTQEQAVIKAKNYLDTQMGFSEKGLVDQLAYNQFSQADATAAVKSLSVDFNEQAAIKAKNYVDTQMGFSRGDLIDQLLYNGFTQAQAEHGADAVGL